MAYMKFQEYLDNNKKLQTSGDVQTVADFKGKVDTKPNKEKMHKDAGGKGQDGEVKPYKGGSDAADPNNKMKDGFAHKGDTKLKYEPDTDVPKKVGDGGKKAATWPKTTKTQEWIDKTKGMSLAEFTKSVRSEALKGLDECSCQESPHNSIKETISVCKCNNKYVSALVREMKRNGLFGKLVKEMAQHPETFQALANLMERDESYARKLAKALNEMVAPPIGMNSPVKKDLNGPVAPEGDMGDEDSEDMEDEMGDEDMEDEMGDEDSEGEDSEDMGDEDEEGLDDDGTDEFGDEHIDAGSDDMPPPKKLGAHQNLMNAMKNHPALGV